MVDARRRSASVAALVFSSGLCALVYQVAWLRELRLIFGASTPASAAVLAVFMGGLGFGGLLLGRRVEASAEPLAFYGKLEIGAALFAGLSPLLLVAARHLYLATGGSSTLGLAGSTLVRLALTALVLGVPTLLMGGTLPAIGRAVTAADDRGRRSLGWMYGFNTLGAVTGTALTTFLLLETLGQRKSLLIAALLNLLVGFTALSLSRRWRSTVTADEAGAAPVDAPAASAAQGTAGAEPALQASGAHGRAAAAAAAAPLPLVLAGAAIAGFAFFLMELVWYRLLAPLLGGTTYTFGVILLLALAGIGTGGLLYGAAAERRQPTLGGFAATCAAEALLLVVPLVLSYRLPLLASTLRSLSALGFGGTVLGWLVVGAIVVLPASLVAGYQFPLLVALLGAGRREVARQTGLVYACNTAGAIAGSLAGGFGLLPLLGAPGAWRFATLLLAALALVCAAVAALHRSSTPARTLLPAAIAVVGALLCLLPGPGALWRNGGIGVGRPTITATNPNELRERVLQEERAVLWEEDGRESTVALRSLTGLAFSINGKIDGHARGDASTQVMSPLVGAVLHPAPRRAVVVGLGTGSSAGWLAAVPGMEKVDVVELEPAVVKVARDCAAVNRDVLRNPKVNVVLADGREFLLTRDERWDLVVSEPSNPYLAGIASLFTTEFYRAAAGRLAPGGLFVQWLQAYQVDADVVASVYTSLAEVFPYVETWATNEADMLLIASMTPVRHDLARESRLLASEPFRRAMADGWGVAGIEGFYAGFVAAPGLARRMASIGAPPNTDDRPVIEFGLARGVGGGSFSIAALRGAVPPAERRPPGLEGLDWRRVEQLRMVRGLTVDWARTSTGVLAQAKFLRDQTARVGGGAPTEIEYGVRGADGSDVAASGDSAAAEGADLAARGDDVYVPLDLARSSLVALVLLGEELAERGDDRAAAIARALQPERPIEAAAVRARWHARRGRNAQAVAELEQALLGYRRDPWPWPALTKRTLALAGEVGRDAPSAAKLLSAVAEPFAVHMHERDREALRLALAAYAGGNACLDVLHDLEPNPLWEEPFLRQRAVCYAQAGDPLAERARRDLESFIERRAPSLREALARASAAMPAASAEQRATAGGGR